MFQSLEVSRGIGLVEETSLRDARGNPEALVRVCTEDPPSQEYGIGHRADTETAQFRRLKSGPRSSLVQPKFRRPRTLPIVPIHYRYKFSVSIRIITMFVNKYWKMEVFISYNRSEGTLIRKGWPNTSH